jgi:hypothetical protein
MDMGMTMIVANVHGNVPRCISYGPNAHILSDICKKLWDNHDEFYTDSFRIAFVRPTLLLLQLLVLPWFAEISGMSHWNKKWQGAQMKT